VPNLPFNNFWFPMGLSVLITGGVATFLIRRDML